MKNLAKGKKPAKKNCPYNECPHENANIAVDDNPNFTANLLFRVIYCALGWWWLGMGIIPGTGFFTSVALFAAPLFIDYVKFTPNTTFRQVTRFLSAGVMLFIVVIGFEGMSQSLTITVLDGILWLKISDNFIAFHDAMIPLKLLWEAIGAVTIFITVFDWGYHFAYENKMDNAATAKA